MPIFYFRRLSWLRKTCFVPSVGLAMFIFPLTGAYTLFAFVADLFGNVFDRISHSALSRCVWNMARVTVVPFSLVALHSRAYQPRSIWSLSNVYSPSALISAVMSVAFSAAISGNVLLRFSSFFSSLSSISLTVAFFHILGRYSKRYCRVAVCHSV